VFLTSSQWARRRPDSATAATHAGGGSTSGVSDVFGIAGRVGPDHRLHSTQASATTAHPVHARGTPMWWLMHTGSRRLLTSVTAVPRSIATPPAG
jgi:hypothetical protein